MDLPPYAVAIVTHDAAADLPACLAAVGALRPRPAELAIVDCASVDTSAAVARAHLPAGIPAVVRELRANQGFAGGMNEALAGTRSPFVLSLNADVRPRPDYAARLLAAVEGPPAMRIGAATGRLLRFSEPGAPPRLDACGMRLTWTWRHLDRESGRPDHGQLARPERVFGATGAASLLRRAALEDVAVEPWAVDGASRPAGEAFAAEFHSFREDAELAFRLRERGWEVVYEPSARAAHRRFNLPQRRRAMSAAVNLHSLKNRYLLRLYHQTAPNFWLTLLPALGRDLGALAYALLCERTSLPAYAWLWRHRRTILARRRAIQGRRLVPAWEIDRWFFRPALPR